MKRRDFLQAMLAGAGALTTSHSLGMQMTLANAMAAGRFTDHKALVCIFLYGGNDSFNMLVPTELANYQSYSRTRQNLAVEQSDLLALNQTDTYAIGMPSAAQPLADLFNQGRLSFVTNLGPLRAPVTKQQVYENESLLPPELFSHNDQQDLWQKGTADKQVLTGWGGRMADLLMDTNSSLPMNFSIGSTNLFQSGQQAQSYVMNTEGPENFASLNDENEWDQLRIAYHQRLLESAQSTFGQAYAGKIQSVRANNRILIDALDSAEASGVSYPANNELGEQLQMIANLISIHSTLGQNRQIFFAGMGGFDTHDNQANFLPVLQSSLAQAMAAFDADLQARGLDDQVVTFTQSEFGRTLTSNGDGTDHGWAGHQIVMGNSIDGGKIIGDLPEQVLNSQDDLGDGRIIPTTSLEQFGVPFARWFGLTENEINEVFPLLGRFDANRVRLFSG